MADRYFIRLNLDEEDQVSWEEVDETVFKHRREALNNKGEERYYFEDYVIDRMNAGKRDVQIKYSGPAIGLPLLMRMLNIQVFNGKSDIPIFDTPTHIKFKTKLGGLWMYELETGQKFKINKKAS